MDRKDILKLKDILTEDGGADMKAKVKICGLTKPSEAQMLNKYGADYAGFVMFYEKSKRNNTVQNAWNVLRYLDRRMT